MVVNSVDVSMAVDQLLHHAIHSEPGCQDQGSGSIIHACIQLCRAVTDQNLAEDEDTDT